jgi:hypothetical protein
VEEEPTHKRILVAVDGSSASNVALDEAIQLARSWRAALRIAHVIDVPYSYPDVLYGEVAAELEPAWQAWRQAGERVLAQAGASARRAELEPDVVLLQSEGRLLADAPWMTCVRWGMVAPTGALRSHRTPEDVQSNERKPCNRRSYVAGTFDARLSNILRSGHE